MPVKSLPSARSSLPPDVRADVVRLLTDMVIARMTRDFQAKSAATEVSRSGVNPNRPLPSRTVALTAEPTQTTPAVSGVFVHDSQGASCQA